MDDIEDFVVLEWKFSPPDYFEGPIDINRDDYVMTISSGMVEAQIKPEMYDKDHSMRDRLHRELNRQFQAVQMLKPEPYDLSKASIRRSHPDGRKDVTILIEPCVITGSTGAPDIIVKDKDGSVISDSKQERLQKMRDWLERVDKCCQYDSLVDSLLDSSCEAVKYPDSELVHLYEIRDAIAKKVEVQPAARNALRMTKSQESQWKRLGELANDPHLKQGRHRGKNLGILRDATEGELNEARDIARNLFKAYLCYLESQIDFR